MEMELRAVGQESGEDEKFSIADIVNKLDNSKRINVSEIGTCRGETFTAGVMEVVHYGEVRGCMIFVPNVTYKELMEGIQ